MSELYGIWARKRCMDHLAYTIDEKAPIRQNTLYKISLLNWKKLDCAPCKLFDPCVESVSFCYFSQWRKKFWNLENLHYEPFAFVSLLEDIVKIKERVFRYDKSLIKRNNKRNQIWSQRSLKTPFLILEQLLSIHAETTIKCFLDRKSDCTFWPSYLFRGSSRSR